MIYFSLKYKNKTNIESNNSKSNGKRKIKKRKKILEMRNVFVVLNNN